MKINSLQDLLADQLQDIYSAETQLVQALPKMAKAARAAELKRAFEDHLEETKEHVNRLTKIFERLGIKAGTKQCKAMQGLVAEGDETISQDADPAIHDAALIAAAQRVEHYEIAAYGCVRTYASLLGDDETASMLEETLEEEEDADDMLTDIAMSGLNEAALNAGGAKAKK
ncbi:MAG: ferritin-like protein [Planctomycetaceae bacterium]|nr:ferritin-like protein [Planctomycetaceae bacterium]